MKLAPLPPTNPPARNLAPDGTNSASPEAGRATIGAASGSRQGILPDLPHLLVIVANNLMGALGDPRSAQYLSVMQHFNPEFVTLEDKMAESFAQALRGHFAAHPAIQQMSPTSVVCPVMTTATGLAALQNAASLPASQFLIDQTIDHVIKEPLSRAVGSVFPASIAQGVTVVGCILIDIGFDVAERLLQNHGQTTVTEAPPGPAFCAPPR